MLWVIARQWNCTSCSVFVLCLLNFCRIFFFFPTSVICRQKSNVSNYNCVARKAAKICGQKFNSPNGVVRYFWSQIYKKSELCSSKCSNDCASYQPRSQGYSLERGSSYVQKICHFCIILSIKHIQKKHHFIQFDWKQNFHILDWPYVMMILLIILILVFHTV